MKVKLSDIDNGVKGVVSNVNIGNRTLSSEVTITGTTDVTKIKDKLLNKITQLASSVKKQLLRSNGFKESTLNKEEGEISSKYDKAWEKGLKEYNKSKESSKEDNKEEEKLFTSDDLTTDQKKVIKENTINAGQAALNGESTTAFTSEHADAKDLISGALQDVGSASSIITNSSSVISSITNTAVGKIENVVLSYMTDKVAEMLEFDVGKITSGATKLMTKCLETPSKAIEKIMADGDDLIAKGQEDAKNQTQKEQIENLSENSNKVKKNVADKIKDAEDQIKDICQYITNGEDWLVREVNKFVTKTAKDTKKYIGQAANTVIDQKNKYIDSQIEAIANQMAGPINAQVEYAQKKLIDAVSIKKQAVKTKAKATAAQGIMKLKAMAGS